MQQLVADCSCRLSSVLWHSWLGVRKSIWPVKIEGWGVGVVVCLEQGADCIWTSWCHCIPEPHRLLPHLNPDWFYLSSSSLPRLSRCSSSVLLVTHCIDRASRQPYLLEQAVTFCACCAAHTVDSKRTRAETASDGPWCCHAQQWVPIYCEILWCSF